MLPDSSIGYDSRPDTWEHIHQVQTCLGRVIKHLMRRSRDHDQSKLAEPELSTFNEYTPKLRDSTYGSAEYKAFLEGMGEGLRHHYEHNSHHPEHHPSGINGMSLLDIVEMLADWKAATLRHADGDLRRSIEQNKERFGYGDQLEHILLNTAEEMGWL